MKKSNFIQFSFILLCSIFLFTASCKKNSKVPNIFTYNLNNQKVDCSKNYGISERVISGQTVIWGRNEESGFLDLVLDTTVVGSYNQTDYVNSLNGYSVNYTDHSDKLYTYSKSISKGQFIINLKKYDDDEISATFSAVLFDLTNNSDSVIIEDGVFSFGL